MATDPSQGSVQTASPQTVPTPADKSQETARIFISHKSEDRAIAEALRDILKDCDVNDPPKLTFCISEDIPGGENWYEWIRKNLRASNLLILIYTDPTRTWDWCLFEAGLFDDVDGECHKRITCLHGTRTTPPGPLKEFQCFAATTERITKFVDQFFIGTELLNLTEPVALWLKKISDKKEAVVAEICSLIDKEAHRTDYYCKRIFMEVDDPGQTLTSGEIPPDAKVASDDRSLEIFKKQWHDGLTWQDLKAKAEENEDNRWIAELAHAMKQVADGDVPDSIQAIFPSLLGDKAYRPILYRADRMAGGSIEYKILFSEDATWRLKGVPGKIGSLLTVLVMAVRFKYEVIDSFRHAYARSDGEKAEASVFAGTRQAILTIISAARSRGTLDRDSLLDLFQEDEQSKIKEILGHWSRMRTDLLTKLEKRDGPAVDKYLEDLSSANTTFLVLCIERFRQLLEKG